MRPKKVLTDEQTGQVSDRIDEFKDRVLKGKLPFHSALEFLQRGIEGRLGVKRVEVLTAGSAHKGVDYVLLSSVMNLARESGLRLANCGDLHSDIFREGLPPGELMMFCEDDVNGYYRTYALSVPEDRRSFGYQEGECVRYDSGILASTRCVFVREP
jgi:hypothetical protein